MREQIVNPAESAVPNRAHFHESPFTPVMRPSFMPGTTTNWAFASVSPLLRKLKDATADPPGRGPAGAKNEGTKSILSSEISTVMPKRAMGASGIPNMVTNTGHSGVPTFAEFDMRTVRFTDGVALPGSTAEASLISQRIAGPDFFVATVVTGATDVAVDAFARSGGEAICGTLPVPETQTHLPAVAVLIF